MNPELIEAAECSLKRVPANPDPLKDLSKRELQIMIAIASGKTPALAAEEMEIAVKTFSTYRARVLEKLGLKANVQLAVLAFELKLVPSVLETLKKEDSE